MATIAWRFSIKLDHIPSNNAVMRLAHGHCLTVYDAAYLEIAKREDYQLATLDKELIAAAHKERVKLLT